MGVFHFVIAIVLIVFLIPVIALVILGGLVITGVRTIKGESPGLSKEERNDETRLIQEIYQGLSRMEERISALETILLDPERKK